MYSDRIRALRAERGISRQRLADELGVSATAVYKWETGQSQPGIELLRRMADFFHVSLDILCDHFSVPEDCPAERNMTVLTRGFRQLTQEEQEKYLAVGRALFGERFGGGGE